MARVAWKEGAVVRVRLKAERSVLGQMLKSPYIVFFDCFTTDVADEPNDLEQVEPLFCCAVTRQWLKFAALEKVKAKPATSYKPPQLWIDAFVGSRSITAWKGTKRERTFIVLHERPGGRLVEKDVGRSGVQQPPVRMASIPMGDAKTIDGHELNVLWTYPLLEERLHLCAELGCVVDPLKDIMFERSLRDEYAVYIDILASHGSLKDWGYE